MKEKDFNPDKLTQEDIEEVCCYKHEGQKKGVYPCSDS
jgi:hypothetical protein